MLEGQSSKISRRPDFDQRYPGKRKAELLSTEIREAVIHQSSCRHYNDEPTVIPFKVSTITDESEEASVSIINLLFNEVRQSNAGCNSQIVDLESKSVGITKCFPLQMATTYPFPTLWGAIQGTSGFADLLPSKDDIFILLEAFKRGSRAFFFPYIPEECMPPELEQFLRNFEHCSIVHPDRVALLLATLAVGVICEGYEGNAKENAVGSKQNYLQKGDLFGMVQNLLKYYIMYYIMLTQISVAASMQALRTASFMSRPSIRVIETLLIIDAYLANSGKSLDASSLFATTVRLAQVLGSKLDRS